jgi:sulfatase maturation enzyme AslB (radical SAM superfamily)
MIVNSPPMAWKEFLIMFLKRFLSESVRDIKAYEFERLVQGDLTVTKYEV